MDERLDYYSTEEMLRKVSSQYMVRHNGSADSLERESSRLFLKYKDYHLHLVEKKELPSERVQLPASKMERMAYYRQYVNSITKTQIVAMQSQSFNQVFWFYIFNILLKSLPHTYVHIFLGTYTPGDHIFIPKMIPFIYGFKFGMLLTSLFEILTYLETVVYLLAYIIQGVTQKSPWNRNTTYTWKNITVYSYDIEGYRKKMNESWTFRYDFTDSRGENFQLAQVKYYHEFSFIVNIETRYLYMILLWTIMIYLYKNCITKKLFWKIFNALQACIFMIEAIVFLYLLKSSNEEDFVYIPSQQNYLSQKLSKADVDMIAELTSAPPVIHVLTATSNQEVHLNQDSSAIIVSNALVYILKGLLMTQLRYHCQNMVKGPIKFNQLNPFSFYYMWPIFFTSFFLGDLYFLVYLALNCTIEMMTLAVTFYCAAESIVCEWAWIKWWMIASASFVLLSCPFLYLRFYTQVTFLMYSKCIVTLTEIVMIYGLYPVGRLVDDITFHTGQTPTKFTILAFKLMPVYYMVKIYVLFDYFLSVMEETGTVGKYRNYMWSWQVAVVPYFLGFLYVFYKYVIQNRRGCQWMFIPVSTWGPQDQTVRGFRKLYNSRDYIGSQALRSLSRYMFEKSESKAFKLDLNYDPTRQSISTSSYCMENEKKVNL